MILGLYSKLFPNLSAYNDMFNFRLIYRCFAYYF